MTTITLPRATVEQALEALENCSSEYGHRCNRCDSEVDEGGKVAAALRTALAQQAEPVDTDCHTQGICQRSGYGIGQQAEPVELKHRHEWFRTGGMEPGQFRCIHCGAWGQEQSDPQIEDRLARHGIPKP